MKRFILAITLIALLACASYAVAGMGYGSITDPGGAYSTLLTSGSTTTASFVQTTNRNVLKGIILASYSASTQVQTATALTGTVSVKCGVTSSGPWVQAYDVNGNAITGISSQRIITLQDFCQFLQVNWTHGTGTSQPSIWALYSD